MEAAGAAGDWTTLPDAMGHDDEHAADSCTGGWQDAAPVARAVPDPEHAHDVPATGTTGAWNAASGDSEGWQQWVINLDAYAGQTGRDLDLLRQRLGDQGLGVFIDDVTLPDGSSTSFEGGDTGGWTVAGPPPGSAPNANNCVFTTGAGFPEGAAITTEDTIYLGFGFEAITGAADTRGGHGPRDGLPAPCERTRNRPRFPQSWSS